MWIGTKGDSFSVEPGEFTDFATVPWFTQWLIPRTGTWTKAAVLHDKMCNMLNEYYRLKKEYDKFLDEWRKTYYVEDPDAYRPEHVHPIKPEKPVFSSNDTDFIFRKNARDDGTGLIRSELLWVGVRLGALVNPARRGGWMCTFPRLLGDLVAIVSVLSLVIWGLTKIL